MFVKDVTMTIADGEFVAVVGRSGSGKTTLMGLLGALEQPTNGMIVVDEQDVTRLPPGELVRIRQRKIGFVFQSFHLISNLTAVEKSCCRWSASASPKPTVRNEQYISSNKSN
jgi:putative ABC transport system ATP-binding protein